MFDKLKKLLEGGIAQANIFDGGKTYQSVVNNRTPQQQNAVQQQQQQARVFNPARPQQAPQQNFTDKLRDILDANSQADKFRRAQMGQATSYQEQQAKNPNTYNQVAGMASKVTNTGPVGLFNDVRSKGFSTLVNPNDLIRRGNPFAGVADVARQESNKLIQQNPAILNDPNTKSMYEMTSTPRGLQDAAGRAITTVGNAPVIRDVKEAPGINVLNDMLISPILRTTANSLARVGSAGSGSQSYSTGLKGAAELGSDIYNVGTMAYAPAASRVLSQGGQAALRAIPGAAGRGFLAGSGANVQQQLADGASLDDINLQEAALSGGLGGTVNAGLPLAGGAIGRQLGKGFDALGNLIRRPRSVAEITQEVATARQPAIANNAPRVTPDGTQSMAPRSASQIAQELADSKARAIDPNVQARRAAMNTPSDGLAHVTTPGSALGILDDGKIRANPIGEQGGAKGVSMGTNYKGRNGETLNWADQFAEPGQPKVKINIDRTKLNAKQLLQNDMELTHTGDVPLSAIRSIETDSPKVAAEYRAKGVPVIDTNAKRPRATLQAAPNDPLEALKAEARKYKSADEFVKAKTNQYHGTLDEQFSLDPKSRLFLTGDADSASTYAGRRYDQKPTGKVAGFYAKEGKTLDLNSTATREKYVREVLGQDKKLKQYYDKIPEGVRNDYYDTLDWVMSENKAGRIPRSELDNYTKAQQNYKNISSKDVYTNWDKIIAKAKKDGYDYIKHTTEDPSAEITFPETVAINPSKSLLDEKQLTDLYNQATKPPRRIADPLEALKAEASYRSTHQIDSSTARNLGSLKSVDDIVAQVKGKYGLTNYDQKDITALKKIVGNPEADVKIYRASPINEVNSGDWVTTSKSYANDIKRQNGGKVYEYTVKAKELNLPANIEDNPSLARFSAFQYNQATKPPKAYYQNVPKSYTKPKTAFEQNTGVVAPTRAKGTINTERLNLTDAEKADLASRQNPVLETDSPKVAAEYRAKGIPVIDTNAKQPRATLQTAPKSNDPLEALKAEARKYKSAEEFVKAQGESVYHRSPNKFSEFDISKVSNDTNRQRGGWGFYFSDAVDAIPEDAYGKYLYEVQAPKGTLLDTKNPVDEKIVSKIVDAVRVNGKNPSELSEFSYNGYLFYKTLSRILGGDKEASLFLSKNGIDGLKRTISPTANDYILFNDKSIKTKQQLTDLYNQATKPKAYYQNVPKSYTEPKPKVQQPKTTFEQNTGVVAPTRAKGTINTERLNLTDAEKVDLASRQNPILETMSHKEVQDIARGAGIDTRSHTIEQTKEIIAKQLNTRGEMVALERKATKLAKEGGDPTELGRLYARLDELGRASTEQGTDIARQLSARRILADESKTPMQRVFNLLNKAGVNPEVYTKKAIGVDFDSPNDVIRYYRELVPPTKGEWLDVVRYNSMLSSPLTQIVNISSTSGNIAIAPIERTVASGLDFINSLVTGKPRKFAGGEGLAYAKGMVQSLPDAVKAFRDSVKGIDENMNLDVSMQGGHIPVAAQGQNKLVDVLQLPTKLLGAFDNYHRAIVAGGSDAALSKRVQAGINVRNREVENAAEGAYRTFNQEIGEKSQGALLGGIDEVTAAVNRLRSSKYAVVRLPAKFTLPFVRIGANLMKQGIEYSPAGFATIPGANDKTTQLAKALMGTAVFGTAAGLLGKDRLTWAEPVDPDQKAAFKQAGKQPYSMKIGDNWIGFSKLPPIISFNMAMVAALDDAVKSAKLNENGVDNVVTAIAKYGNFLADQSYVKSVGDLLAAVKGDPEKLTALVSNYPQQMVPMRAFSGWIAKMTDDTQRKVNTDAGFAAKQVESLMQQIPGLRQQTTARVNEYGEPIASQHPVLNAFSPVPVSTENPGGVLAYDTMVNRLKTKRDDKALLAKQKEDYKSGNASGLTDKQKAAVDRSIREDEVVKGLTPVQRELYKYSKEDLESLLDGPNAKNAKVALDAKNSISSSKEAKTNKEKYEKAFEDFNDPDNGYSKVEKVKKREELKRLTVQKDYDEDTTMLHGMSKEDVWGFLSTYEDGKAMADKLLALDDALTAAGVQDKNKFRDKYGNVAIKPKEKSSGKGGSKAKTVKGQADAVSSERKLRALLANTNNKASYRKPATQSAKIGLKKFAVKSAGITSRKGV